MKRVFLLALLILGTTATAHAEFNYNFVQGSYGQIDYDDFNVDGDNFALGLSLAITDEFHLFGGAEFADLDFGINSDAWQAGVGYNTPISPIVDVVAQLSFQSIEFDGPGPGGNVDDTGLGIGVLLRFALTDLVELNGGVEYVNFDDFGDTTALTGAALFNLTERFSVGLIASFDDDVQEYSIAGRAYF